MQVYKTRSWTSKESPDNRRRLDPSQRQILRSFLAGKSVAILGGAGSGKTFVLTEIVKHAAKVAGGSDRVAICALTNNAAGAIGGCTLHSLFSAPASWEWSKTYLWEKIEKDVRKCAQLSRINVLIIDEISLIKRNQIEAADYVLRKLSKNEGSAALPLGGRQLVVAGDPFQLESPGIEDTKCYFQTFFQSRIWFLCFTAYGNGVIAILDHNHRQSQDAEFFDLLQRLRYGVAQEKDYQLLNGTSGRTMSPPLNYTRLCLYVKEVKQLNLKRLKNLDTNPVTIQGIDQFLTTAPRRSSLLRLDEAVDRTVILKPGCLIILTRKCNQFMPGTYCKVIRIINGDDKSLLNLRVLLSVCDTRVTSVLRDSDISNVPEKSLIFELRAVKFEIYSYSREVIASRRQLPIILGYAMTIHRCQGFSLDTVAIDFNAIHNWHPNGMVYVALSRCRTMAGIWVRGLQPERVSVSERAKQMMRGVHELFLNLPERVIGTSALQKYVKDMENWARVMNEISDENGIFLENVEKHMSNYGTRKRDTSSSQQESGIQSKCRRIE